MLNLKRQVQTFDGKKDAKGKKIPARSIDVEFTTMGKEISAKHGDLIGKMILPGRVIVAQTHMRSDMEKVDKQGKFTIPDSAIIAYAKAVTLKALDAAGKQSPVAYLSSEKQEEYRKLGDSMRVLREQGAVAKEKTDKKVKVG